MPGAATWKPGDTYKKVSWSGTVEQVEAEWEKLRAEDEANESKAGRFFMLGLGALILGVVAALVASSGLVAGVGVVAALILWVIAFSAGTADLEDHKLQVVRTLVTTFRSELRPGSTLEVTLDFRGYWRFERGESWMTMKMVLDNGVVAQLSLRDSCKRKTRAKRKYTKIKDKLVQTFVVRFVPPKGQTLSTALSVGTPSVSVGPLKLRHSKIAPRSATFVFATDPIVRQRGRYGWTVLSSHSIPSGADLVRAMIGSYHLLGHAGAQAAAQG